MRVAIVPGALALLPQYAGLDDPIPELRLACQEALAWLLDNGPTPLRVLGDVRIAQALLPEAAFEPEGEHVVVIANGSARRGEKAPGHLDSRAQAFDDALGYALSTGDAALLDAIDEVLAEELLAAGIPGLKSLAHCGSAQAKTWYAGDPFGVQYWVVTWEVKS